MGLIGVIERGERRLRVLQEEYECLLQKMDEEENELEANKLALEGRDGLLLCGHRARHRARRSAGVLADTPGGFSAKVVKAAPLPRKVDKQDTYAAGWAVGRGTARLFSALKL